MKYITFICISLFIISCKPYDDARVLNIGESIMSIDTNRYSSRMIKDVVFFGPGLYGVVKEHKRLGKKSTFNINPGDYKHEDKADCILEVRTGGLELGIRIKYDAELDKYHILGFAGIEEE